MTSVSSRSKRSTTSSHNSSFARSYQPVPPLKSQLQTLDKTRENILSIVNDYKDVPSFITNANNFHDGLIKILNDLSRCFTGLFRRQNPDKDHMLTITSSNYDYLNKLKGMFDSFRNFQRNILLSYIDQLEKLQMLVEFWEFVEDNEAIFINEIWHYCSELYIRTKSKNDPYDEVYQFFCDCLDSHYENLNDLQLKFISGVKQFDLTKDFKEEEEEDQEEEEEEIPDDDDMGDEDFNQKKNRRKTKLSERQLRQKVVDSIRRSYSLIFPTLKEYWKNAYDWELQNVQLQLQKKKEENEYDDEQDEYSEELDYDVKLDNNFIYKLFDKRLSQIENFYMMASQLKRSQQQPKLLIKFITEEATLSFNDQLSCVREMWEFASQTKPRESSEYEMTHFGSIIVDNLKSEAKYNPTPKSLSRLGEIFEQAENVEDLQTAQQVINIIITQLKDKIELLTNLYDDELQQLKSPPDSKYVNKYVTSMRNKSKEIDELAKNIAQSIKRSEAAAFVHQKLDPDVEIYRNDDADDGQEDEEYPMKKELKELVKIGPDFYGVISDQIINLNKELNNIYDELDKQIKNVDDAASVRSSQTYNDDIDPMTNYHNKMQKRLEKRAKNKQANDALSVYAPSSKSVALHANTRKREKNSEIKVQDIKKEYRIRIELIQEAICRTYEEFFASIRALIINAVRYTNDELAENYNKKLESMFKQYLTHLNVLKKWYIQEMKVDKVEAVEARMAKNQGVSKKIINDCIKESLREMATQYVNYYIKLNEVYDDDFDADNDKLDRLLFEKMDNIKTTIHIKQLEIIEQQYRIEMKKEKNRDPSQVIEAEKKVRTLLASKQYDEARKEKDKCIKLRASLWREKKKEIQKKYTKIRNEKLEQQARDLELLEQSYNKKRILLEKDYRLNQENSKKSLKASLHNKIDFHVKLAAKLNLSGNPNKVETQKSLISNNMSLTKSYEAITNSILAENNIEL